MMFTQRINSIFVVLVILMSSSMLNQIQILWGQSSFHSRLKKMKVPHNDEVSQTCLLVHMNTGGDISAERNLAQEGLRQC